MKNKYIIGYYNLANLVTLVGLACAVLACFMVSRGQYVFAMLSYGIAALCDALDGRIARATTSMTKRERFYGVQLDSLCDVISFGAVPCFMAYMLGYNGVIDILIFMLFVACGVTRLANFNTEAAVDTTDMKPKFFTGMPIPFSQIIFPLLMIVHVLVGSPVFWLFRIVYLLVGLAFVLRFRMPKPGGKVQLAIGAYELVCLIALIIITIVK
ncbi:MAG: CDP-alcohol phosphatidyltransferase family protein [Clostridia bacterium]|nr:CDP-alcohol phosphatidyltransferase family protein [Clostridia bacterium]